MFQGTLQKKIYKILSLDSQIVCASSYSHTVVILDVSFYMSNKNQDSQETHLKHAKFANSCYNWLSDNFPISS